MTRATIHAGGPRSARTQFLDRMLADHWGRALLIVPTRGAARQRVERVLRTHALAGSLGPAVIDFKSFAEAVMLGEGEHVRKASDLRRRMILETALAHLRAEDNIDGLPSPTAGGGLVAHLLDVITQLKQAALEPHEFRARVEQGGAASPLDAMTTAAYEAYQHALIGADLYDVPGLYWRARILAEERRPRALAKHDLLLFDGFDDFTPSEFRLVTALAPHVERVVFGIPLDLQSRRTELHAQATRTLEKVRAHFDASVVEHESAPCATLSDYAADNIFWRDRPESCTPHTDNLRITACIDPQHEAETIARRVRDLIIGGVAPARIAVVYHGLSAAAPWLRAAMAEFSVPAQVQHAAPLAASACGAFLANVLRATDRWERESIAEILASPLFAPSGKVDDALLASAGIARRAMILEGPHEWRQRLEAYAQNPQHASDAETARIIAAAVTHLAELTNAFPPRATLATYTAAADALLSTLNVELALKTGPVNQGHAALTAHPSPPHTSYKSYSSYLSYAPAEPEALIALRALLTELATAADGDLTREDFLHLLNQALRDTPGPAPRAQNGVACLDAANARHLDFDHVFFGGLNEGAVPRPSATNAIYNEIERARLHTSGVELEGRKERAEREMALYYHVLSLPRVSLTLLYRLNEGGREAAPSPFLVQTMELFKDARPEVIEPAPLADSFLPPLDAAASAREVRNAAFFSGAAAREALFPSAAAGAAIERARFGGGPFDAHDGLLLGEDARALLATRYGDEHVFSVNQIEKYAECPFQFFVSRALRVEDEDAPEAELGHKLRGSIMHRILQQFYEHFTGRAIAEIPEAEADIRMREFVAQVFEEQAWKAKAAPDGVLHAERQRMERVLSRYLAWARAEHGETWKPTHFELAFGPARGEFAAENAPEFVLALPGGAARFSGRIDRVDEHNGAFRLMDYKGGGAPGAGEIKAGTSLQLGVYALACEQLLFPGHACAEAFFVRVGHAEDRQAIGGKKFDRDDYNAMLLAKITQCLTGIRAGTFPPLPQVKSCHGCTTAHICRHEKARIDRKEVPALFAGVSGAETSTEEV